MGDMIDGFKAIEEFRKQERVKQKAESMRLLNEHGIEYSLYNNGAHVVVDYAGFWIDFWPSTGKWSARGTRMSGDGVQAMLALLKEDRNGN